MSKAERSTMAPRKKPKKKTIRSGTTGKSKTGWVVSPLIFAIIIGSITIIQAIDGNWNIWWVKWLCVPSLIAGLSISFGEIYYRLLSRSCKESLTFVAIIALGLALVSFYGYSKLANNDIGRPIVPGNEQIGSYVPDLSGLTVPPDKIVFVFGGCLDFIPKHRQSIPIVVSPAPHRGENEYDSLLEVSFENGGAFVSGQFFDEAGQVVAVLHKNKPIINLGNSFNSERPSDSSLIVRDLSNTELINLRFINSSTILFRGTIRAPSGRKVIITDSSVRIPHTNNTAGVLSGLMFTDLIPIVLTQRPIIGGPPLLGKSVSRNF